MSSQHDSPARNESELDKVLEKHNEIARKSARGDYIYRGEPEHYDKVSSSLYRLYERIGKENINFETFQEEVLSDAKKYTGQTDQFEILAYIQHYGGKTNLIDFTTNSNVALFFACSETFDKDGRIVFLRRKDPDTNISIKTPWSPEHRVIAQKSVFVQSKKGYLDPSEAIGIPKELKQPILAYLRTNHSITTEEIYKDLHGFIRQQNLMDLPARLTASQIDLCNRMDELHTHFQLQAQPSDMFRGLISVMESQSNPDRIAQAAHSLREIIYPFWSSGSKVRPLPHKTEAFDEYGTVLTNEDLKDLETELDRIYDNLSHLAHHGIVPANRSDFPDIENLRTRLEGSMERVLTRQAEIYNEIDQVLSSSPR